MIASELPQVKLKIARRSSHPWIFQKMVEKPAERIPPGTVVDIVDRDGQWVGRGFFNWHSRIALRLLTTSKEEAIDADFFAKHLSRAVELRRNWLNLDAVSNAYRVVHSEGDGLSGLVVDRFGSTVVIEFFAAGMYRFRDTIRDRLSGHFPDSQFYWFAEEHVQKQESFDCHLITSEGKAGPPDPAVSDAARSGDLGTTAVRGEPTSSIITEHGLRFRVAPGSKHKTGFFADQRDNRKLLASFCAGKRVLDLCCNTGGFAVYAKALGQAEEVVGVDLDEQALALAKQNANLNQAKIRFVQADIFTWLRDTLPPRVGAVPPDPASNEVARSGDRATTKLFDVVILDPSKQTRDREEIDFALKRYYDMNKLALQAVAPGGIFLTCSCTGLISEEMFLETLRRSAYQAGRTLQIIKIAGAGPDHPFLVHVPEGRYLKAIFCRVE